jgi:hypothetical protein
VSTSELERRLQRTARLQVALAIIVVGGMFIVIALLALALTRAGDALHETKQLSQDNCYNLTVTQNYFDSLDRTLTATISNAPRGVDLRLLRQLVFQARLTSAAMITPNCQEAQG